MAEFKLQPRYGKQSVPVFKIRKAGTKHEIIDMMVKIMLEGEVSESWFTGENHQILPTETQKNTCYAIALKATFDCIENYAITLARDILSRHAHIVSATVDVEERIWTPVVVGGKQHSHVFTSGADPVKKTCHVVVKRGAEHTPDVTSGLRDIKLMKTTASGFAGYIVDQYTNLQPVGDGSKSASRIMCTLMEATWHYNTAPPLGYAATNATVIDTLIELYSGPADTGVYSKSVQETAYKMCTEALRRVPALASVHLVTPNIHHYLYNLEQFGLPNDNVVFQSTDCHTTASGRIETNVFRPASKL